MRKGSALPWPCGHLNRANLGILTPGQAPVKRVSGFYLHVLDKKCQISRVLRHLPSRFSLDSTFQCLVALSQTPALQYRCFLVSLQERLRSRQGIETVPNWQTRPVAAVWRGSPEFFPVVLLQEIDRYCGLCNIFSDPIRVSKIASTCRRYATTRDNMSRSSGSRSASRCHFASTTAGTSMSCRNLSAECPRKNSP